MEWRQIGQTVNIATEGVYLGTLEGLISHDGTRVVIGTTGYFKDEDLARVKVLDFDGESWNEVKTFSGQNEDGFGYRIALSGNGKTLAIGVPDSSEGGVESGHVEVYHYEEGTGWMSKGSKLVGLHENDRFGASVALSEDGNRIAIGAYIGAPGRDSNEGGYVSIFYYDKDIFRGVLQHAVDHFIKDCPVSVEWSSIVAEFTGDCWIQMGPTIAEDAKCDFHYSVSLSADGNIMTAGVSYYHDEPSYISVATLVFQFSSIKKTRRRIEPLQRGPLYQEEGQWLHQKLHCGESYEYYIHCFPSINAKGNIIAVGTYGHQANYVRLFHFQNKEWQGISKTLDFQKMPGNISLATNSHRLAVGINDEEGEHVKIYDYHENNWVQVGYIVAPFSDDYCGSSISLSSHGDRLAVGSILNDGTKNYARIHIFQLS